MIKNSLFAAIGLAILGVTAAQADNCDEPNLNGFDRIYCLRKIYFGHDDRLNANYKELRRHLNAADRKTLLNAQRGWIAYRNDRCMVDPDTVNVRCALNTTRDRADVLRDRITECETVGCARSKLSDF